MQLKTTPEDFVVVELPLREPKGEGEYLVVELAKRNTTTERAVSELARALELPRKAMGYAGAKDSRALTRQRVTIRASDTIKDRIARLRPSAWSVRVLGRDFEPLALGLLAGNRFEIVVRDLAAEERITPVASFPNYFDEQRFSTANVRIGRYILQGEYKEAAALVIQTDPDAASRMREHLASHPNDSVSALKLTPRHILLMYVHAYQSYLYNEVLSRWIKTKDPDAILVTGPVPILVPHQELAIESIPMVGFDSDLVEPFARWYAELLAADNLTQRDFVVRAIPFLTLEGTTRRSAVPITGLEIGAREPDELHPDREKQRVTFSLPKGAYATLAIKCLYRTGDVRGGQNT
jgi:tRNA pseudouridine13 synthase